MPKDIPATSCRKLWWRCAQGPDHVWRGRINDRIEKGSGCPFCANRRSSITNNLERVAPELAKRWHPKKNGKLKAADVVAYTSKKAWFICDQGHDYEVMVYRAVTDGRGRKKCRRGS
jgi:hypothetical protein